MRFLTTPAAGLVTIPRRASPGKEVPPARRVSSQDFLWRPNFFGGSARSVHYTPTPALNAAERRSGLEQKRLGGLPESARRWPGFGRLSGRSCTCYSPRRSDKRPRAGPQPARGTLPVVDPTLVPPASGAVRPSPPGGRQPLPFPHPRHPPGAGFFLRRSPLATSGAGALTSRNAGPARLLESRRSPAAQELARQGLGP